MRTHPPQIATSSAAKGEGTSASSKNSKNRPRSMLKRPQVDVFPLFECNSIMSVLCGATNQVSSADSLLITDLEHWDELEKAALKGVRLGCPFVPGLHYMPNKPKMHSFPALFLFCWKASSAQTPDCQRDATLLATCGRLCHQVGDPFPS